ncbi:hypothetical protein FRB98_009167 [Tulasnella sp. 332]|nr:hypothetical protein FRB98_009167 [Tulasnella sp. 332]
MSLKLKIRIPPAFKRSAPEPVIVPEPTYEPEYRDQDQDNEADNPMKMNQDNDENPQSSNESNPEDEGDDGQNRQSLEYDVQNGSDDYSRSVSVNIQPQTYASTSPSTSMFQPPPFPSASSDKPPSGTKQPGKARKSRSKLFGRVTPKVAKSIQYDLYGYPILPTPKGPPKPKPLVEVIQRLLTRIKKKDEYAIFHEPVDTTALPTYATVIAHPMDLSVMLKKLNTGLYRTLDQFTNDFNLMIHNCKTFNPAPSLYHAEATKLEIFGRDLISQSVGLVIEPGPDDPIYVAPTPSAVPETATTSAKRMVPASPSPSTTGHRRGRPSIGSQPRAANATPAHVRHRSTTADEMCTTLPTPSVPNTATGAFHPTHPSALPEPKVWVRGPYKKTIQRDPVVVGPGGELPGTINGVGAFPVSSPFGKAALALELRGPRWRTKKERIEMERRGRPVLWDGSVDWAAMDDVHQVFSHFLPEPFDVPPLQSLTQPPPQDTKFLSSPFPTSTTASHIKSRTLSIITQQEKTHLSPFFTWNPALSTTRRSIAHEPTADQVQQAQEEVRYAYPERWVRPADFGVFNTLGGTTEKDKEAARKVIVKEETARYSGGNDPPAESVIDAVEYVRDVGYGGTDGLAWTRSIINFVGGASRSGDDGDEEDEWEDAPGGTGLGMSLEAWVTKNVLSPATEGVHEALGSVAEHLVSVTSGLTPQPKSEDEDMKIKEEDKETDASNFIQTQLNKSLHINPILRQRIATIIAARKDPITLSNLVKSPEDFQKGDEEWDPEFQAPAVQDPGVSFPPVFKDEWARRALDMAAKAIESLADSGSDVKMEVDGVSETEEKRRLRFNLLALAKFVPIHEGVRL